MDVYLWKGAVLLHQAEWNWIREAFHEVMFYRYFLKYVSLLFYYVFYIYKNYKNKESYVYIYTHIKNLKDNIHIINVKYMLKISYIFIYIYIYSYPSHKF